MPEAFPLEDLLLLAIENQLADVYTSIPGVIETYDPEKMLCAVRPTIKQIIDDTEGKKQTEALPLLQAVPVEFPGAGDFAITFPIEKGDTGRIVFCLNNIGEWLKKGGIVDPGDRRLHGLSGAVFVPGLRTSRGVSADAQTDALTFGAPRTRIGSKEADNPAVLFRELKELFIKHTHPTGVGPSGIPSNAASFDTAASGKVFIE